MKEIYKNIPAFPTQELNSNYGTHPMQDGMTLRDYFAGQALSGILLLGRGVVTDGSFRFLTPEEAAEISYTNADAMMEAREK
jgi:hypothetical protein